MEELIKVKTNKKGNQLVSGRDLYEFLEIETPYKKWFNRMLNYGFVKNRDYIELGQKSTSKNQYNKTQHILKINMAKEICMIQRTDKGKQAREYFIACEEELKRIKQKENEIKIPLKIYSLRESLELNLKLLDENEKLVNENFKLKDQKELINNSRQKIISGKGGITANRNYWKKKANENI